jgi:UDP-N-acetylglucosamine 2-epimerase (non-hydrolysing)
MRVISIVGARPQFIKVAPIARAAIEMGIDHQIVHTGQHYDAALSDNIFKDLAIPSPVKNLNVGSGTHAYQTSEIMLKIEESYEELGADWVLVYGDTNSTLAAALVAVKMGLKTAHIESGLRSFDKRMPEEINRLVTDQISDLLFAPTQSAMKNLADEDLVDRSILSGDVMYDVILWESARNKSSNNAILRSVPSSFYLVTIHRPENTDHGGRLQDIVQALITLDRPCVIAAHPRLIKQLKTFDIDREHRNLIFIEPPNHSDLLAIAQLSHGVITDSGGLQKEAYLLGISCTTVRNSTEWLETLDAGWNVLVPDLSDLLAVVTRTAPKEKPLHHYGEGNASQIILQRLLDASN